MFCNKCGKQLEDDTLFCTGCGAKIETDDTASVPDTAEIPAPAQETPEPAVPEADKNEQKDDIPDIFGKSSDKPDTAEEKAPEPEEDTPSIFGENPFQPKPGQVDIDPIFESSIPEPEQPSFNDEKEKANEIPVPPIFGQQPINQNSPFDNTQPINTPQQNVFPQPDTMAQPNVPPYQQPQEPEQNYAPSEPAKETKVGAGRLTGAAILTVFSIILLMVASLSLCFKFGASGKMLRKRIESLDARLLVSAELDDDEISNDLYGTLAIGTMTDWKVDKEAFKRYLIETDLLEYIGENVEKYADYIIAGKGDDPSVTSEDITNDFFGSKKNKVILVDGKKLYEFKTKDLENIQKKLEHNEVDDYISIEKMNDKAGFELKNLNYVFSYITIGIICALILVFLIWIAVIVDRKGKHLMGFYGNIFFVSGLIVFLIGIALIVAMPLAYTFSNNIIFYILSNILLPLALVALCVGLCEIVLGCIFKSVKKRIRKKEKAAKRAAAAAAAN